MEKHIYKQKHAYGRHHHINRTFFALLAMTFFALIACLVVAGIYYTLN